MENRNRELSTISVSIAADFNAGRIDPHRKMAIQIHSGVLFRSDDDL